MITMNTLSVSHVTLFLQPVELKTATPTDAGQLNFNVQVKLTVELACLSSVSRNVSEAYAFPTFIGL